MLKGKVKVMTFTKDNVKWVRFWLLGLLLLLLMIYIYMRNFSLG